MRGLRQKGLGNFLKTTKIISNNSDMGNLAPEFSNITTILFNTVAQHNELTDDEDYPIHHCILGSSPEPGTLCTNKYLHKE
jgi:hypothetical protein